MANQYGSVETIFKHTWTINDFSKLDCEFLDSKTFFTGIHPWRIVVHPHGDGMDYLAIYLDSGDTDDFPVGWSRSAKFKLSVMNQILGKKAKSFENQCQFNAQEPASGNRSFMTLDEFLDPNNGFLVDDTCRIVAEVCVVDSGEDNCSCTRMSSASYGGELTDFKGLCKIEKEFVQLLEPVCSKHPSLIESQRKRKRSEKFIEWSFTALGRVLHFLNTKTMKDMDEDACKELQMLWEELETVRFADLTWLKPHVQSAFALASSMSYLERAERVIKLKKNVATAEANLEIARSELMKAEKLGYGIP